MLIIKRFYNAYELRLRNNRLIHRLYIRDSIRTRIKTLRRNAQAPLHTGIYEIPLEQGLRQRMRDLFAASKKVYTRFH